MSGQRWYRNACFDELMRCAPRVLLIPKRLWPAGRKVEYLQEKVDAMNAVTTVRVKNRIRRSDNRYSQSVPRFMPLSEQVSIITLNDVFTALK